MQRRNLNADERAVLDVLLTRDFPGRDELIVQAQSVQTNGPSCTCGCPSFSLEADRALPPAPVAERMPTDAHGTDPGGNKIGVLLFIDDGYLAEVEIYSIEGNDFSGLPEPGALRLSEWSEPSSPGTRHLLNP